jgi:hypothetical protein
MLAIFAYPPEEGKFRNKELVTVEMAAVSLR